MRRDLVLMLLIAAAAFFIRSYPAWNAVFDEAGINFLETDAWYHVRLVENQVRNFPWRVTIDPFAAPDGQFVPIAPLFDTVTSAVVALVHGRDASAEQVERVAAVMPPIFGTLTVIVIGILARDLFDRRAGLIAAALLTILPGHFMDRTMLGFVDHHALEALLASCVLLALARAVRTESWREPVVAGVALGLYLLAWGSGAFLVAILAAWLLIYVPLSTTTSALQRAATVSAIAAGVALALVAVFQDPAMHRYGSQVLALVGFGVMAVAISFLCRRSVALPSKRVTLAAALVILAVASMAVALFARDLFAQVIIDVRRLAPDPSRMGVLEARPLFLFSGNWSWTQPWTFFRTGFFIGAIALVPFAVRVWRRRAAGDVLILTFAIATFAATIGQNRFGYYLVCACAVLGGWLAVEILDWAGVPHAANRAPVPRTRMPLAREVAVVAVAGAMFAPNLAPQLLLADRNASYPIYWRNVMRWLQDNTPAPFPATVGGADYYYARYPDHGGPVAGYSIMSWWDQGYWVIQQARRVPVANPTQGGAPTAGRFYSATDEAEARAILTAQRSRFVVSDFELPFRRIANGTIMGRFQTIVDWTGADHDRFYETVYRLDDGQWTAVWLFHEAYYRSMAFRLSVLGGRAAHPANTTTLVRLASRVDGDGRRFKELVTQENFDTYDAARRAAHAATDAAIVGLDPWQSAFPIEALESIVQVHESRTPEQKPGETPWVRVFTVQ